MTLLQIYEPGQTPMPHQEEAELAIGIDLGTTHSLVALSHEGKPSILSDVAGRLMMPSVVAYPETGVLTGKAAEAKMQEEGVPVIRSIKRLMGRGRTDIKKIAGQLPYTLTEQEDGMVRLQIGGKSLSPIEISAEILRSLKHRAEESLGRKVSKAVITVPAYFDDAARTATRDAALLAGLDVLRLVAEPTAAALAYGLDKSAEGIYAVYDLGGGTFDFSVLKMEKGVFQVLATGGDASLGGDDFDREITELFLWDYTNKHGYPPCLTPEDINRLLLKSRHVKEQLSASESISFTAQAGKESHTLSFTREQFDRAIQPYVNATLKIAETVLDEAGVTAAELKGVVLVGGSTRVPLVAEEVKNRFGKTPLTDINPDEVVALGAALQAEGLSRGGSTLLLDVLPLSLGLETMGGIVEKIIHRNTPIPVSRAQEFTTYQDGQQGMALHIVQGERELAYQNRSLARFELDGIPPMVAGAARIKVTFSVDADGLLTVSAREETTGTTQHIEVKPSYGLESGEIETMLRTAMEHGKEDMEARLLAETKVEAERLLRAVESALSEDGDLLSREEQNSLKEAMGALGKGLFKKDRSTIQTLMDNVQKHSDILAERRMNRHIARALKGRKIEEMGE